MRAREELRASEMWSREAIRKINVPGHFHKVHLISLYMISLELGEETVCQILERAIHKR